MRMRNLMIQMRMRVRMRNFMMLRVCVRGFCKHCRWRFLRQHVYFYVFRVFAALTISVAVIVAVTVSFVSVHTNKDNNDNHSHTKRDCKCEHDSVTLRAFGIHVNDVALFF